MPLTKLQFRPGVVRDQTAYTNEGGWRDGNLIRFRLGFPESIGGWQPYSNQTFLGTCRALHNWSALDSSNLMAVGTNLKFYVEEGEFYNDITPIRRVVTLSNPFTATNGSSTIIVTDAGHGAYEGDFVTFTNAVSLGGNITATVLNQEFQVVTRLSANQYEITVGAVANASDTGNGGTSVQASYQINVGTDSSLGGAGWSAGTWPIPTVSTLTNPFATTSGSAVVTVTHNSHGLTTGQYVAFSGASAVGGISAGYFAATFQITRIDANSYTITVSTTATSTTSGGGTVTAYAEAGDRGWGTAADVTAASVLRLWSMDNYGEDLIFNARDNGIYYWDYSTGFGTRAVTLDSLSSDPTCPTKATQILVSDRDRHVIAFGADFGDGIQDPMLIRWSNQEDYSTWSATPDNTAGDLRLGNGSAIICAAETKRAIAVFTNTSLYSMQFIGPPYTFGIDAMANNISIMGFNSAIAVDDAVFWMAKDGFYVFTGQVQKLQCPIQEYIFERIDADQGDKVNAAVNVSFNEVTWFYQSTDGTDCDSYVTLNYVENVWTYGSLARTAWIDRTLRQYPTAASPTDNKLYYHEYGQNDGSVVPNAPLNAYVESSPVDISEGDQFMFVSRIIPDLSIRTPGSQGTGKTVDMVLKMQNYPGQNYSQSDTSPIVKVASTPIGQYTDQAFVRLRGRSVVLRVESNETDMGWRLGSPRLDLRPDGRR
jgi:hypothetical protein